MTIWSLVFKGLVIVGPFLFFKQPIDSPFFVRNIKMHVSERCGYATMSQKFLDSLQILTIHYQIGGE